MAQDVVVDVAKAMPELAQRYRAEHFAAIDQAVTADEAREAIATLEQNWAELWATYDTLTAAHDIVASAIESGEMPTLEQIGQLHAIYCKLRTLALARGVELPQLPVGPCPEVER